MRLAYLDNIKVLLVCGVIAVHTAITYGVEGDWYLERYRTMSDVAVALVSAPIVIGFLFGLGTFFLIAGRLSGPSLDRKGPGPFALDRIVRLGLPILFYVVLISPVMEYVAYRVGDDGTAGFIDYAWSQRGDPAPGPTWFLEALLAFSLIYAGCRALAGATSGQPSPSPPSTSPLRGRTIAAIAIAIAVLSFAVHQVVAVGEEHLHVQFGLFPQYVILFGLGCAAGRRGWLETLDPHLLRGCAIACGLALAAIPVVALLGDFGTDDTRMDRFTGGLHWQAAAATAVEGTLAATAPLLLIAWFRSRWNHQGPLLAAMSHTAYGAFIVHPPVIVGLALLLAPLGLPAELSFLIVLAGGIAGSFGMTAALLRMAPVRAVIGTG